EVGHSVRTLEECIEQAKNDITILTALIESRPLCGNETLYRRFRVRLEENFDPHAFYEAKVLEQHERYLRFNETPYSLEPNCKESPGGLRDIHVIFWIASAAGYGTSWSDLARHGLLTPDEARDFEICENFLDQVRIRLHFLVGRREDRLLFDYQTTLAGQFGYIDIPGKRASEQLMQKYYRTAKAVTLLNTILLQNIGAALSPDRENPPEPIDADFQAIGGMLDVRDERLFDKNPLAIFRSFRVMQEHAELQSMTARTLRALWRARRLITPEFRADPAAQDLFLDLLKNQRGIVHELRRLIQLDLLGAYLPAFGRIVGQMQHDLFHVYTVDQHTVQVMRNLRRFTMSEFAHEYPLCSRLVSDFDRHWLLYVAALFHDIAKGRGGDHSELGMADARDFCETHRLSREDTELVVWLVGNHLVMSHVAQKEDITDPDVISRFVERVGDERHLTALYLLTVADIRGTSPKVWNHWKGKLLNDLYQATRHHLEHGEAPERHGVVADRQAEALRLLRFYALSETAHEELWKQLDTVYFLRHSAEEIAWHTRALYHRTNTAEPVVKARVSQHEIGVQVMVYTLDQADLFARIVGFFGRAGYNIVDAKVHTTQHGYALDSFMLLDMFERESDRNMIPYIEHELTERLQRQDPPEAPSPGRLSRQVRHFPIKPKVEIRPDEKGVHHILTIIAADRPGLLYQIAMALARHGVNLETAKIATLGERAEDVFLISGGELDTGTKRIRLEQELLELLKI
ncbi:MAG: [protein-PII] uridylyltransferase, partial [Betaproteobacteria bacterium]